MVRYLFYTIGDLTYQSPLVFKWMKETIIIEKRNKESCICHPLTNRLLFTAAHNFQICIFVHILRFLTQAYNHIKFFRKR